MSNFTALFERVAQFCIAAVTAAFLTSALVYLYLGSWTVTMQDYWVIYDICLNHSWLEAAFTKVNHHSLFFPSLIWLADLHFFRGNQQLLFFAGMFLLFCTTLILLVPVWREKNVGLTAKLAATLVVVVGSFWMGSASITTSGGFLCICVLAIGGAVLSFLWLPFTQNETQPSLKAFAIVLGAAFVASFSFGTGLAVWPTLLVLGWCLRLPLRSLLIILGGTLTALVVYVLLPGTSGHASAGTLPLTMACGKALQHLCMLLGAPFLYVTAAWRSLPVSPELAATSLLSLSCGTLGLAFATLAIGRKLLRRDLARTGLELTAFGLVVFNLLALGLVVVGRNSYFAINPTQVSGPRYLFWSSFFWAGLILIAIARTHSNERLRWPVFLIAFALPLVVFPLHYKEGLHWRYANYGAECGATGLINGVRDKQFSLFRDPARVYRMAPQFRALRLDMFAAGLQDWIGKPATSLFSGRHKAEQLKGKCQVTGLLQCDNGAPAARVTGWSLKHGNAIPKTLLFVDPSGVVQGIARAWTMNKLIDRTFFSGHFTHSKFLGYIRNYDPLVLYVVRSADEGALSDEKFIVGSPAANLKPP